MPTYKILKNVKIGKNAIIRDFSIIGEPPRGKKEGELKLEIGNNAIIGPLNVVYAGSKIGDNFKTGSHVYIRECNIIGNNVSIGSGAKLENGHRIGNDVFIHTAAILGEGSIIEDNTWIGPDVIFLNDLHPPCQRYRKGKCVGAPVIKRNAKIGARVIIGPGVVIGENSLIGAGSFVLESIPKNSVAIGNPAKVVKKIQDLRCISRHFKRPYEWEKKKDEIKR